MLETAFTCPNGHNFTANAKLRARCTECGALARRSFQQDASKKPVETNGPEDKLPVVHKEHKPLKSLVLLRQGKTMPRKAAPKPPVAKKPVSKVPVKKPIAKTVATVKGKAASGLVGVSKVRRGVTPTIRRPVKRTAPARHVTGEGRKSGFSGYVSEMMRKAGFGE